MDEDHNVRNDNISNFGRSNVNIDDHDCGGSRGGSGSAGSDGISGVNNNGSTRNISNRNRNRNRGHNSNYGSGTNGIINVEVARMSGQRSSREGGDSASVEAGCFPRESRRHVEDNNEHGGFERCYGSGQVEGGSGAGDEEDRFRRSIGHTEEEEHQRQRWKVPIQSNNNFQNGGLAVFSWGRGEDGQLGIGDTRCDTISFSFVCRLFVYLFVITFPLDGVL